MTLVDLEPRVNPSDPMLWLLRASTAGESSGTKRIGQGEYILGHWNPEMEFSGLASDRLLHSRYGVCDDPSQVRERFADLINHPFQRYAIFYVEVNADHQESTGGWRWHKWGEYIGTGAPQCEYIYDEPTLRRVFTFSIERVQ